MEIAHCEQKTFPASTYVWCKGVSSKLGRHPIFVSSPVKFERTTKGLSTVLSCNQPSCSFCGIEIHYHEDEMCFGDGYTQSGTRFRQAA